MDTVKGYIGSAQLAFLLADVALSWGCGPISAAISFGSLGMLATRHMYRHGLPSKRSCEEAAEDYFNEPRLKIVLVGSTLLALVPLSNILLTGGKWADRAYTSQLAIPTLTLAANGYTLASHPDREEDDEASWMPAIEKGACFLGSALTAAALGHIAHSPTPVLCLLLGGSALWTHYRSKSSEEDSKTRANYQLIGVAAASALAATGLLMSRYLEGSLIQGMRGKLITLGQGSLLAASAAVLFGGYTSQLTTSE